MGEQLHGAGPQTLAEGTPLTMLVPQRGGTEAGLGNVSKSWRMELSAATRQW